MTPWRRTIVAGSLTGALILGLTSSALGLVSSLLGSLVTDVEQAAAAAVDGAPDWGDAVAGHLTGPLDGSAEAGRYDDPFFVGWSAFLPAAPMTDHTPSTENDCTPGNIQCVDNLIRAMTKRYERLGCDHNAVFALIYLLTTEEYRRFWETGAFDDPAWLNHYDAVFGQAYFDAFDDWYKDDGAETPPAWRIAFEAADARAVSGMGDVLLGMNGHIRRDLPFVLEAIGLADADGSTRKPDHDRVNVFLNTVSTYAVDEVGRRHDPSMRPAVDVPYVTIDETASVHVIVEWREEAWRKAEMLLGASTREERDRIARWIENEAAASALAIRHLFADGDPDVRGAHCTDWLASQ